MKVAVTSSSLAPALATGDLTQLEWLEGAASELAADGVVFEDAHFPRTDAEYLAQLKKIAIDCGLVPVGLRSDVLLDPAIEESAAFAVVERAAALGALFLFTILPAPGEVPPSTFVASVARAKAVVKAAKRVNITILLAPALETLGSDLAGVRHFLKDVDSAWLRYAAPVAAARDALGSRDHVLALVLAPSDDASALTDLEDGARAWFVLDGPVTGERTRALRIAAAKKTLASANVFS